jgi:hypothetical protein
VLRALQIANRGVAILARTVFLESVGRYDGIFSRGPPTKFAQFVERVPMVKGRLDGKATTATGYAWSSGKRMWRGRRALCGFYRVGSSLSSQATMTCRIRGSTWSKRKCRSAERELLNTRLVIS